MHLFIITFLFVFSPFFLSISYADGFQDLCDKVAIQKNNQPVWGADYVAGVDAYGNAVASADLGQGEGGVFNQDFFLIPVEIDLAERFGLILPRGVELKPEIFNMIISSKGRVFYGDDDVTSDARDACKEYYEENPDIRPVNHGQKSGNTLPSDDKIEGQYPEYNN